MARYGDAFRSRMVARLLPPESADIGKVSIESGIPVQILERWREAAQTMPARGWAWSAADRLEDVITAGAKASLGKYLAFYNTRRPHQSLDGQTPDAIYFTRLPQERIAA